MELDLTRRELLRLAAAAAGAAAIPAATAAATTAWRYDDGTRAVPGGLAGDPERVIVIGAGWAGLALANALRHAGVEHVVLEARDRIGGRAHTVELDGVPVDVGCSWIHQPVGNPMSRFARQTGVRLRPADVELDALVIRFFDARLRRELAVPEKLAAFLHAVTFAQVEAGRIARRIGPRASVADGAAAYLDRRGLTGDPRRHAAFVIRMLAEFVEGEDWRDLSLTGFAWSENPSPYFGLGQGSFPDGGYRRLIGPMAAGGDVRLGHRVEAVEVQPGGVVVRGTAGGRSITERGSHVVVTVPLGVLKAGAIAFEPELPAAKRAAIAALGFGVIEKVALVFDRPFWAGARTHSLYVADHEGLEFPWVVDLHRIARQPGLIMFSGGPFARHLNTLPAGEVLDLARARLREMLRRDVPRPVAARVTNWQAEPESRGSYSHVAVGGAKADYDTVAEPVGGRLLFAGEATNRVRHSLADGALSSGVREAKRLLRRSSVTLTAG